MSVTSVIFSDHAQQQIKERELSRQFVVDVVQNPDEIVGGRAGRKIAQRIVRQGRVEWLFRVVYVEENGKLIVVTMYRTTKLSKYLKRQA